MQIPWRVLGYLGCIGMLLWGITPALAQQAEPRMVTVEAYARIRSGPTVNQPTLKQYFEPTPVEALAYDGLYWMVLAEGQVGYVIDASVVATESVRAFFEANAIPLVPTQVGVATSEENPAPTTPPVTAPGPDAAPPTGTPAAANTVVMPRQVVFRVGFGTALPMAPPKFPDLWQRGISLQGSAGYSLNRHTEFGVELSYNALPLEREQVFTITGLVDEGAEVVEGDVRVITVMGFLKLNVLPVGETVAPYLLFGGGAFGFNPSDLRIAGDEDPVRDTEDTDFLFRKSENVGGFMLGGGVDLRMMNAVFVFLEARGVFGLTEREGTFLTPFRLGLMFRK